jgi:lipopolysaccharide biosynthesis glycosyltransferase
MEHIYIIIIIFLLIFFIYNINKDILILSIGIIIYFIFKNENKLEGNKLEGKNILGGGYNQNKKKRNNKKTQIYNTNNTNTNNNTNNITTKNNAYVWLLMKGDNYLPGIIVSMYSVKRTKTPYELVCMVTSDVSENAKNIIKKIGKVIEVDYLKVDYDKNNYSKSQNLIYGSWLNVSPTKWNCLKLIEYDKVLFLDADTIIFKNIDELFYLNTPAAVFDINLSGVINFFTNYLHGEKNKYGFLSHGEKVTKDIIRKILYHNSCIKKSYTLCGAIVLLSPSLYYYEKLLELCKDKFGFKNCNSGIDEQIISYLYSIIENNDWTNIDNLYNFNGYISINKSFKDTKPYVINYLGEKPWLNEKNIHADCICWFKFANKAFKEYKINTKDIPMKIKDLSFIDNMKDKFFTKYFNRYDDCLDFINNKDIKLMIKI